MIMIVYLKMKILVSSIINIIGTNILSLDSKLYLLYIIVPSNEVIYTNIKGTKRKLIKENFVIL